VTWVDDHSGHGGANFGDGGAQATVMYKMSTTLAMADTATRRRCTGETRPIELKQKAWEGSAAHPDHDRAKSKTGGVTETLVDVHSDPGGANNDDGGEPVTVMDKMSNQPVTERHRNKVELEVH